MGAAPAGTPTGAAPRPAGRPPRGGGSIAWRPALVFAGLAVVTGGIVLWSRLSAPPAPVARGEAAGSQGPAIEQATLSGGAITVRWSSLPGVTRYQLRFQSPDQVEWGRIVTANTAWSRFLDQIGFPIDTTRAVLVRVGALTENGRIEESPARELQRH